MKLLYHHITHIDPMSLPPNFIVQQTVRVEIKLNDLLAPRAGPLMT